MYAPGEVAEWSNALGLKPSVAVMSPWVQIPPSPFLRKCLIFGRSQFCQTHPISIYSHKGRESIATPLIADSVDICGKRIHIPIVTMN